MHPAGFPEAVQHSHVPWADPLQSSTEPGGRGRGPGENLHSTDPRKPAAAARGVRRWPASADGLAGSRSILDPLQNVATSALKGTLQPQQRLLKIAADLLEILLICVAMGCVASTTHWKGPGSAKKAAIAACP